MLFMGEEYGEKAPFQYFTSHSDADLIAAVRRGRREEFVEFAWAGEPPDPDAVETFQRSKLQWSEQGPLRDLYKELLRLRRSTPALRSLDLAAIETHADDARRVLLIRRDQVLIAFNFSDQSQTLALPFTTAPWKALIDTGAKVDGDRILLPAVSFAVFRS